MKTETITWHEVAKVMPDSDITVLISSDVWSEPVEKGYHDGDRWRLCDATPLGDDLAENPEWSPPTLWAHMPFGAEVRP